MDWISDYGRGVEEAKRIAAFEEEVGILLQSIFETWTDEEQSAFLQADTDMRLECRGEYGDDIVERMLYDTIQDAEDRLLNGLDGNTEEV